jgi:hypothetical protein
MGWGALSGPPKPPRAARRGSPAARLDLTRLERGRQTPQPHQHPPGSPGNARSRLAVFEGGEFLPREHGLRSLREVID